jgi:hypothetical protein
MICPNKNTEEWKRLVAHFGSEDKAYVAFFRHQGKGLTGVPAPENATDLVTKPSPSGIANAEIDKERAARGAEPLSAPARKSFGQVWDEASRAIDKNAALPSELLTELSSKPRAISDLENAVLAHEKVRVINEVEKAHVQFAESQDSGDLALAAEARTRSLALDEKLTQLDDLERTLRKVGTEQGRGLAARRMMVNRDYTLASMLNDVRASKGEALTPEEVASVEGVFKKYKAAKEKIELSDEERLSQQAEEHFKELKKEVAQDKTVPERDIDAERAGIVDKIKASVNEGEPVENLSRLIQKLARNAIERGIKERDAVLDDVAKNLKDAGVEMERSNLRNELSGYGKYKELSKDQTDIELRRIKGELQQVGKLEDMAKGEAPKKTGTEKRQPSDEERRLIKLVNEEKRKGGFTVTDPARQLKTSLDSIKTRLRNQIKDLDQQVTTRTKILKNKTAPPTDPEVESLRVERDKLKAQYDEIFGKPELTDEQRIRMAKSAVERSIADLESRIKAGETTPKARVSKTPVTPELEALRARKDALRAELDALKPKPTERELALSRYKTRKLNQLADLLERTASEDFRPRTKPKPFVPDAAGMKLAADVEKAKQLFEQKKLEYQRKNRTTTQKTLDAMSEWTRFAVLSSPKTIGKLLAASMWRFGSYAAEEGIGAVLSKLPGLSEISKRAPSEGKGSLAIEAQSIAQGFTEGLKDAEQILKTGKSGLDLLYGKKDVMPQSWLNWAGNLHGAIKAPIIRAAFTRSFAKRAEFLARQGVDVHDPMVQMGIATEAYKDAQRAAFKQDNRAVTAYNNAILSLENSAEKSASPTGKLVAKAGATAARVALPVVKVPMNIVAETFQNLVGTVTGSVEAGRALAKGVETLKPEEADVIMRQLKKGLVGNAMLALGWYAYQSIGGFYERGRKPGEDEPKPGEVMVNGSRIPRQYLHSPAIEAMMYAANAHRVAEEFNKSTGEDKGITDGLIGSSIGILEEVPFMDDVRTLERLTSAKDKSLVVGEFIKSRAIPQGITWAAQQLDKDENGNPVPRKPETFWQEFENSIPGLRQDVPEKR